MTSCGRLLALLLTCAAPAVALAAEPARGPSADPTPEMLKAAREVRKEVELKARDSAEAATQFAALLEQGDDGFPPDRAAALDIYEKAAAQGERTARAKMCRAFLLGDGRPKDVVKAAPYCNSLGTKDATGLFWAAYDFDNGLTGPKDEAQALDLYAMSASSGSGDAAVVMGRKALAGGKPEAARAWFRLGAGHGSADAMTLLAQMLDDGQGGPVDTAQATWLYSNAAGLGNADALARVASRAPLPFLVTGKSPEAQLALVRTYMTPKGERTEKLTIAKLASAIAGVYPETRSGKVSEGSVRFQCFIKEDHVVAGCLIQHEFPVGYGFGKQIQAAFGHIQFPEKDLDGQPTAGRVFKLSFRWQLR